MRYVGIEALQMGHSENRESVPSAARLALIGIGVRRAGESGVGVRRASVSCSRAGRARGVCARGPRRGGAHGGALAEKFAALPGPI